MTLLEKVKSNFDALFKHPLPATDRADPLRSQTIVASEYLGVPQAKRAVKNTIPAPPKSQREQDGLSRRDVVAILNKIETYRLGKKDKPLLPERDTKCYRDLAAGNTAVGELANQQNMSPVAFVVFIADIERIIIGEAAYLRKCCGVKIREGIIHVPDAEESATASERQALEDRATDEKSIGASGGAAIGGRIVSRGKDSEGNYLALDTFERGGVMKQDRGEKPDYSDDGVEHDDYSDESKA
jgi:hypothetical protein